MTSTTLPAGTTSGSYGTRPTPETRTVYHGSAPVYYPAPGGGSFCNTATCTHDHPDTTEGYAAAEECSARLARIIESGRLPKWATLAMPI